MQHGYVKCNGQKKLILCTVSVSFCPLQSWTVPKADRWKLEVFCRHVSNAVLVVVGWYQFLTSGSVTSQMGQTSLVRSPVIVQRTLAISAGCLKTCQLMWEDTIGSQTELEHADGHVNAKTHTDTAECITRPNLFCDFVVLTWTVKWTGFLEIAVFYEIL